MATFACTRQEISGLAKGASRLSVQWNLSGSPDTQRSGCAVQGLWHSGSAMRRRSLRWPGWCAAWLFIGWLLGVILTRLSFRLPLFVEDAIRFGIRISGHQELDNPEDLDTLALLTVVIMCFVAAVFIVWGLSAFTERCWLSRKRL